MSSSLSAEKAAINLNKKLINAEYLKRFEDLNKEVSLKASGIADDAALGKTSQKGGKHAASQKEPLLSSVKLGQSNSFPVTDSASFSFVPKSVGASAQEARTPASLDSIFDNNVFRTALQTMMEAVLDDTNAKIKEVSDYNDAYLKLSPALWKLFTNQSESAALQISAAMNKANLEAKNTAIDAGSSAAVWSTVEIIFGIFSVLAALATLGASAGVECVAAGVAETVTTELGGEGLAEGLGEGLGEAVGETETAEVAGESLGAEMSEGVTQSASQTATETVGNSSNTATQAVETEANGAASEITETATSDTAASSSAESTATTAATNASRARDFARAFVRFMARMGVVGGGYTIANGITKLTASLMMIHDLENDEDGSQTQAILEEYEPYLESGFAAALLEGYSLMDSSEKAHVAQHAAIMNQIMSTFQIVAGMVSSVGELALLEDVAVFSGKFAGLLNGAVQTAKIFSILNSLATIAGMIGQSVEMIADPDAASRNMENGKFDIGMLSMGIVLGLIQYSLTSKDANGKSFMDRAADSSGVTAASAEYAGILLLGGVFSGGVDMLGRMGKAGSFFSMKDMQGLSKLNRAQSFSMASDAGVQISVQAAFELYQAQFLEASAECHKLISETALMKDLVTIMSELNAVLSRALTKQVGSYANRLGSFIAGVNEINVNQSRMAVENSV